MESRRERRERIIGDVRTKLKDPSKPAIPSSIKCVDQNYIGLEIDGINAAICLQVADTYRYLGFDTIRLEEIDFQWRDEVPRLDLSKLEESISIEMSPVAKVVRVEIEDNITLTFPFKTRLSLYTEDGGFYMNLEKEPEEFDNVKFRVMLLITGRTIKEFNIRTNE